MGRPKGSTNGSKKVVLSVEVFFNADGSVDEGMTDSFYAYEKEKFMQDRMARMSATADFLAKIGEAVNAVFARNPGVKFTADGLSYHVTRDAEELGSFDKIKRGVAQYLETRTDSSKEDSGSLPFVQFKGPRGGLIRRCDLPKEEVTEPLPATLDPEKFASEESEATSDTV